MKDKPNISNLHYLRLSEVPAYIQTAPLVDNPFPERITACNNKVVHTWLTKSADYAVQIADRVDRISHDLQEATTEAKFESNIAWQASSLAETLETWHRITVLAHLHDNAWCPSELFHIGVESHLEQLCRWSKWINPQRQHWYTESLHGAMQKCRIMDSSMYDRARRCVDEAGMVQSYFVDVGPVPPRSPQQQNDYRLVEIYREKRKAFLAEGKQVPATLTGEPLGVLCPFCMMPRGTECITRDGNPTSPHKARTERASIEQIKSQVPA